MSSRPRVHDRSVLDQLESFGTEAFHGFVWRVVRKGRDALRGSSANGRWSPGGEFDVLYTSFQKEGALAEVGYRLSLEPVWPSRIEHVVHKIEAQTERTLRFKDLGSLALLGVDVNRFDSLDYAACQAIAAAANFLEFDSIVVPSARFPTFNLVIFLERIFPNGQLQVVETEDVDWSAWLQLGSGKM